MINTIFDSNTVFANVIPEVTRFIANKKSKSTVDSITRKILSNLATQPERDLNRFCIKLDQDWCFIKAAIQKDESGRKPIISQMTIQPCFSSDSIAKIVSKANEFIINNQILTTADSITQQILTNLVNTRENHVQFTLQLEEKKYSVEVDVQENRPFLPEIYNFEISKVDSDESPRSDDSEEKVDLEISKKKPAESPQSPDEEIEIQRSSSAPLPEVAQIEKRFSLHHIAFNIDNHVIAGMKGERREDHRGEDHMVSLEVIKRALSKKTKAIRQHRFPPDGYGWYFRESPYSRRVLNLALNYDPVSKYFTVFAAYFMPMSSIKKRYPRLNDEGIYQKWFNNLPSLL